MAAISMHTLIGFSAHRVEGVTEGRRSAVAAGAMLPFVSQGTHPDTAWMLTAAVNINGSPRPNRRRCVCRRSTSLHIHAGVERVLLDEHAAWLDVVAHQLVEQRVRLVDLLHADLQQ